MHTQKTHDPSFIVRLGWIATDWRYMKKHDKKIVLFVELQNEQYLNTHSTLSFSSLISCVFQSSFQEKRRSFENARKQIKPTNPYLF